MKFINEKSTEEFKVRESNNYEVLYDRGYDMYGLLVDDILFTTLTKDQATTLESTMNDPAFESFFNSVGIGDEFLNMQPKAACSDDYKRPTGEVYEAVAKLSKGAFTSKDVRRIMKLGEQLIVCTHKGSFKIVESNKKTICEKL